MQKNSMIGKRVLIKYGEDDHSDESGKLLSELEDGYILEDKKGRIIFTPKNSTEAKIISLQDNEGGDLND